MIDEQKQVEEHLNDMAAEEAADIARFEEYEYLAAAKAEHLELMREAAWDDAVRRAETFCITSDHNTGDKSIDLLKLGYSLMDIAAAQREAAYTDHYRSNYNGSPLSQEYEPPCHDFNAYDDDDEEWNTDDWAYNCLTDKCSHSDDERCGKRIVSEGWHESIQYNRLMTREEYRSLAPIIAAQIIQRWVNMQPEAEKEAAEDKAAEFLVKMEAEDEFDEIFDENYMDNY
jgi:hypothetical protein